MHNHTDKPCKHDLHVCTQCGDVYCDKCGKEWFKDKSWSWVYANAPYTITSSGAVYTSASAQEPHQHAQ